MTRTSVSPREHALGVLARRVPGDFAIDFDFEPSLELIERMKNHYQTDDFDAILDGLGVEFRNTVVFTSAAIPSTPLTTGYVRNAWGVLYDQNLGAVVNHPLQNITTMEGMDSYNFLNPDLVDYDAIAIKAERYGHKGNYCVYGGYWAPITYIAQQLVGMDRYMMLYYDDLPLIEHLLDRITDIAVEINERIFHRLGDSMQVYFIGDDYGTQLNPMTSMDFWRTLVKPRLKRIIDPAINRGYRIQFHSCGSVEPLIPDFVDLGVDAINPIQVTARNMEPSLLMERHGKSIAFNGGVDTQQLLPFGTPKEIRKAVRETIEVLSREGGYVFGPSQSFLPDIPVDNIVAMYEEALCMRDSLH